MKSRFRLFVFSISSIALAAVLFIGTPAYSQHKHRPPPHSQRPQPQGHWWRPYPGAHPGPWVHVDISPWYGGRWVQTRHDGRVGWWWVVGTIWYFYPAPVYPYPDPYAPPETLTLPANTAPATAASPPVQYWYYCPSVNSYYPYVGACPEGWTKVPAALPAPGG